MGSLSNAIQNLAIFFPPFLIAVIFHEFAHGYVANRWGDSTARDHGRLTLNPLVHIDPIGTILFPALIMITGTPFLIGWAKPVPINPTRFKKYRPGLLMVSAAGPLSNFILGTLSAFAFFAITRWVATDFYLHDPLLEMTRASITLNFALGVFNLLPLPPLDGSKIIESFLSYEATKKFEMLSQYSFWIFMGLMFTGAFSVLAVPILFLSRLALGVASLVMT